MLLRINAYIIFGNGSKFCGGASSLTAFPFGPIWQFIYAMRKEEVYLIPGIG